MRFTQVQYLLHPCGLINQMIKQPIYYVIRLLKPIISGLVGALVLTGCQLSSTLAPVEYPRPALTHARVYYVMPGDSLYAIAWSANQSVQAIAQKNNLKPPYTLHPGQRLILKTQRVSPPKKKPIPHVVKRSVVKPSPRRTVAKRGCRPLQGSVQTRPHHLQGYQGGFYAIKPGHHVRAVWPGTVAYVGQGVRGYGHLVLVKHANGFVSAYGFNQAIRVKKQQIVHQGQILATSGQSPEGKSGLYFELRQGARTLSLRQMNQRLRVCHSY